MEPNYVAVIRDLNPEEYAKIVTLGIQYFANTALNETREECSLPFDSEEAEAIFHTLQMALNEKDALRKMHAKLEENGEQVEWSDLELAIGDIISEIVANRKRR